MEFNHFIATKGSKLFTKKGTPLIDFMNETYGPNVLSAISHDVWHRHRSLLSPAFTDSSLICVNDATVAVSKGWIRQIEVNNRRNILTDAGNVTLGMFMVVIL